MIYRGARPRVTSRIKYDSGVNQVTAEVTKRLAKALLEPIDKKSLAQTTAYVDEEGVVEHRGQKYRYTAVRLYSPLKEH